MDKLAVRTPFHEVLSLAMYMVSSPTLGCTEDVLKEFPNLRWKVQEARDPNSPDDPPGKVAFAIIGGSKDTGEIHVLAVIENAAAPAHTHGNSQPNSPYGELIFSIAGALEDVADNGKPVRLLPGMHLVHGPSTTHRPHADFWFGYYHQPSGMQPVGN